MAFKTIDVPGHGQIDFPETMSDDDIGKAIRENILKEAPAASASATIPANLTADIGSVLKTAQADIAEAEKNKPKPKDPRADAIAAAQRYALDDESLATLINPKAPDAVTGDQITTKRTEDYNTASKFIESAKIIARLGKPTLTPKPLPTGGATDAVAVAKAPVQAAQAIPAPVLTPATPATPGPDATTVPAATAPAAEAVKTPEEAKLYERAQSLVEAIPSFGKSFVTGATAGLVNPETGTEGAPGAIGRMVGNLAGGAVAGATGPVGAPLFLATQFLTDLKERGLDPDKLSDPEITALAAASGLIGGSAPIAFGKTLLKRALTGAAIGAAQNLGEEEIMSEVTKTEPERLKALILGGAFGAGFGAAFRDHAGVHDAVAEKLPPSDVKMLDEAVKDLPTTPAAEAAPTGEAAPAAPVEQPAPAVPEQPVTVAPEAAPAGHAIPAEPIAAEHVAPVEAPAQAAPEVAAPATETAAPEATPVTPEQPPTTKPFDFSRPTEGNALRDVQIGDTKISLDVRPDGPVEIGSIRTPVRKRGEGSGRAAMEQLIKQADDEGVTLSLGASPLDKVTLLPKLVKFYESLGFKATGEKVNQAGEPVMVREPVQAASEPTPAEISTVPAQEAPTETAAPASEMPKKPNPPPAATPAKPFGEKDGIVRAPHEDEPNTSAKKTYTTRDRAALGLDEIPSPERRSWQEALDKAHEQGYDANAETLARTIVESPEPRALNDVETAGMVRRMNDLKIQHESALDRLKELADPALISEQSRALKEIEQKFDVISKAVQYSGTEKGRNLAAQKMTINKNYDLIHVVSRAKAARGRDLLPEERAKFDAIVKEHKATEAKLAEAEARIQDLRARDVIKERTRSTRSKPQEVKVKIANLTEETRRLLRAGCLTS